MTTKTFEQSKVFVYTYSFVRLESPDDRNSFVKSTFFISLSTVGSIFTYSELTHATAKKFASVTVEVS